MHVAGVNHVEQSAVEDFREKEGVAPRRSRRAAARTSLFSPGVLPENATGVAAGRREAFYATIAGRSSYRARLSMPEVAQAAAVDVRLGQGSGRFPEVVSGPISVSR